MRMIPAIDLIDGKCVRLSQGDFSQKKIYNEDPLEVAKTFEDSGIKYLHLVDLDGAKSGKVVNHKTLNRIASNTKLKIDFGGGIRTTDDLVIAFENGANQITAGSVAVDQSELVIEWLVKFGPSRIILGADCRGGKIATSGWQEESSVDVIEFIHEYESEGITHVISTDISKDGMLAGPSLDLYGQIITKTGVNVIASGGIASINDICQLKDLGCEGAIIGKAIYENRISLKELSELC